MPLKHFCVAPGCRNLCDLSQRYCIDHEYLAAEQETERNKQYDQRIRRGRDIKYTQFYHSPEWEMIRSAVLNQYNGLDLYAYYADRQIVLATTVHHIIELKDNWSLRLTLGNLVPVSSRSHSEIGKLYETRKAETQERLREMIRRWDREMKGQGV